MTGPEASRILVDHHRPEAVTTKTYQLLKNTLQRHYQAGICIEAYRESLSRVGIGKRERLYHNFLLHCALSLEIVHGFGPSLDERLRDQLVGS